MGIWGSSGYQSGYGHLGSILGSILGQFWPYLDPILGNLIKYLNLPFIWPWVGPEAE